MCTDGLGRRQKTGVFSGSRFCLVFQCLKHQTTREVTRRVKLAGEHALSSVYCFLIPDAYLPNTYIGINA
jgi:hypothetical protein